MFNFLEVSKEEINKFNMQNNKGHIFQTSMWCEVKNVWEHRYIGGYDNKKNMVLSCSILKRKIPYTNKYIGYSPRGFVCDYTDKNLMKSFVKFMKDYAKKENIAFITFDPDIHLKENEIMKENAEEIISNLKDSGLSQLDSSGKNFEAIQPKFVFRLDISNKENIDKEELKKRTHNNFHQKWKYNIKLGKERGLTVEYYDKNNITPEIYDEFQRLMDITGKRDNFVVRNKQYFVNIVEKLSPYARIYLVKYNLNKDLEKTTNLITKLEKEIAVLNRKIKDYEDKKSANEEMSVSQENKYKTNKNNLENSHTRLAKLKERLEEITKVKNETGKDSVYLSGSLYLYYGNKAWYLYGASSNDFRDTMPSYVMQNKMIEDSIDLNADIYDFRGVSGDTSPENPLYGLYRFKKGYGGDFVEYVGEFDLIVNKTIYKLFKDMFPKFKKVRAKLLNRK